MMEKEVTVGRIVHFYLPPGGVLGVVGLSLPSPLPAMICAVHRGYSVKLSVFGTPFGTQEHDHVPYNETPRLGHWNWPPR